MCFNLLWKARDSQETYSEYLDYIYTEANSKNFIMVIKNVAITKLFKSKIRSFANVRKIQARFLIGYNNLYLVIFTGISLKALMLFNNLIDDLHAKKADSFLLNLEKDSFYNHSSICALYSSADNKFSNCSSSEGSITTIQAFSYGDSFTNSGLSSNSSFTSTTSPLIVAYNSETVFTDSTLPNCSSNSIVSPTSGNSTNTISPSSD